MARKRIIRRTNDGHTQGLKRGLDTNGTLTPSVTTSVRAILLVLIGVGICAFLFYPDITRIVSLIGQEGVTDAVPRENSEEIPVKGNDLMEDEEHYRDFILDEEDESELHLDEEPLDTSIPGEEVDKKPLDTRIPGEEVDKKPLDNRIPGEEVDKKSLDTRIPGEEKTINMKTKHRNQERVDEKQPSHDKSSSTSKSFNTPNILKFAPDDSQDGPQVMKLELSDFSKKGTSGKDRHITRRAEQQRDIKKDQKMNKVNNKSDINMDLPKEVREFKAQFLDSVTAKKIFVDGRRLPPIELLPQKEINSSVRVFLYDEFLSTEECDGLVKAHDRHVTESNKIEPILCFDSVSTLRKHLKEAKKKIKVTPNVFTKGTRCLNTTFSHQMSNWLHKNWSYSTAFYPGESRFSTIFSNRVKAAMGLDQENGGKFQLTSYPKGKAYKSHTDCIVGGQDERDRIATVLVYLQDVEEGGETKFPDLGIWVKPRKGRALVWNNMDQGGKCDETSIHTATKVIQGNKYVLLRWYYYKSFYSLGKRPPDPPLPMRDPGTPRVSCDEFEHGSCRWYDEWNYEHMLDYEQQKLTLI